MSPIETEGLLFLLPIKLGRATITPHFWKCGMYLLESMRRRLCRPRVAGLCEQLLCVACHRCQTGGRSWRQPCDTPPPRCPSFTPCLSLSSVPSPALHSPQGHWSPDQMSPDGTWEESTSVEVSFRVMESQSVGRGWGVLSLPQGLVLTNKDMGQDLLPILQMGRL